MILTNNIIKNNLQEYSNKNTKICRKVKNGKLIKIINGLYETDPNVNGYLLAGSIYGPSYLSFDFALLEPNKDFDLSKYFSIIEKEVQAYGLNLTISEKEKTKDSNIMSAFLKGDTKEHILMFFPNENMQNTTSLKNIKIKFEVDINPPSGASFEFKYKLLPSPHQVRLYDESSLFAGKIHALLCRNWTYRTKGRDLYDYIFYLSKNAKVNLELIRSKLIDSNVIAKESEFNIEILKEMLNEKFQEIDYTNAKEDVITFINDKDSLNLWSAEFFIEITKNLEETNNI